MTCRVQASPLPADWIVVCAWCQAKLPEDQRVQGENVSHGICQPCSDIFLAPARARERARITRALGRMR